MSVKLLAKLATIIFILAALAGCSSKTEATYLMENIILSMNPVDDYSTDNFLEERKQEIVQLHPELHFTINFVRFDLNNDNEQEYLLYISSIVHSSTSVFYIEIWERDDIRYSQIGEVYFDGYDNDEYEAIIAISSEASNGYFNIISSYQNDDKIYHNIYKYDGYKYAFPAMPKNNAK